jgi:hypothetical protein
MDKVLNAGMLFRSSTRSNCEYKELLRRGAARRIALGLNKLKNFSDRVFASQISSR